MNPKILLFIIKLSAGGIVAFLAILLMSKKRNASWTFMTGGFLFTYIALVYELLIELGIVTASTYLIFGIPLSTLISAILPSLCFITSFLIKLIKNS